MIIRAVMEQIISSISVKDSSLLLLLCTQRSLGNYPVTILAKSAQHSLTVGQVMNHRLAGPIGILLFVAIS